jgi:hypothetical protein
MNNLLLKNKSNKNKPKINPEADGLLSSLLFDNKLIDINSGVNENIIEEVNDSLKRS